MTRKYNSAKPALVSQIIKVLEERIHAQGGRPFDSWQWPVSDEWKEKKADLSHGLEKLTAAQLRTLRSLVH